MDRMYSISIKGDEIMKGIKKLNNFIIYIKNTQHESWKKVMRLTLNFDKEGDQV